MLKVAEITKEQVDLEIKNANQEISKKIVPGFNKKTITYYDSMGGKNYGLLCRTVTYLNQESMDKRKLKFDLPGWKMSCLEKRSPQQTNNYDCGVFAMVTAELISRKEKISFSQDDIQAYRKQIYSELFNGKLCQ